MKQKLPVALRPDKYHDVMDSELKLQSLIQFSLYRQL